MTQCDIAIIGGGPAGLYAAYYAGFRGFSVTLIDVLPELGGQISAMYPEKNIYDVAGFPTIKGQALVDGLSQQARAFSPNIMLNERVCTLNLDNAAGMVNLVTDNGTEVCAKVCLITGGIGSFTPRPLPVGSEFLGRGLVYFVPRLEEHRNKDVLIVGGGDSAFDWAVALHGIAKSITIVHRRDSFRAHAATVEQVRSLGIELVTNSEIHAIKGSSVIESVTVASKDGSTREYPCQTLIAALGFIANIGPIENWGLQLDKRHIVVDMRMRTSLERVFAAGDIATYPGKVALISVGFGEAALAVNNAVPLIDPSQGVFPGHSSGGAE